MRRGAPWLLPFALAVLWVGGLVVYLCLQEIPTAVVRGKALAEESGQPLRGAYITFHGGEAAPSEPTPEYTFRTRSDGTFRARRLPAGIYTLEASTRAHKLAGTTLVLYEGETRDLTLELAPDAPFFDLRMPQLVFTPDEHPRVSVHGFTPHDTVDFAFYRVDPKVLYLEYEGRLGDMVNAEKPPEQYLAEGKPGLTPAGGFSGKITQRDLEGMFHQRFDLPVRAPGIYVIDAKADAEHELNWMVITRLGLIVKHWGGEALAYVADLKTGTPIPGARVSFTAQGKASLIGTSDADGLYRARLAFSGDEGATVLAAAEKDGSQAFLTYYDSSGEEEKHRVYAYTDRPVYRPGHRAFFNAMVRTIQHDAYAVPANQPVEVEVKDSRDSLVFRKSYTTDAFGAFHGDFSLSEEAATGYYSLVTTLAGEKHESGFKVAEYRKPEYQVQVTTAKKRYTRGETIEATVSAEYYFGAPVAGAEVKYEVMRSPYYYYPGEEGYYGYGEEGEAEYYDYGEMILEGKARTDEQGVAHLSLPTKAAFSLLRQQNPPEGEEDSRYLLQVTVTDPSRKEVTAEGATLVTQGEFALTANPLTYLVTPEAEARVKITAQDYDGKPVPRVKLEIIAQSETWGRGRLEYGEAEKQTLTADARGEALCAFTPDRAGYYRLQVTAYDRRGNRIRTRTYVWVTEEDYADLGIQYPELEVVADKAHYQKGDTATLLINTSHRGATALVTVEGPRLYDYLLVPLRGNSTRLSLPLKPEYAPNCFVTVALVRDKQFSTQEKQLLISVKDRELQVEVKSDKARYQPGERATYSLLTRDARGRPVQAEASLGVVDEAIYAVQGEMVPPLLKAFYPPRWNAVETTDSFPWLYLDANKEPIGVKVRRRFPDTAFWNPAVITNPDGRATVSFTMPDTLTTWRATVRAATRDTEVGQAVAKVIVSKDLLVRLEAPRFFTQKDRLTISALVHNYTRATQDLKLWITAPGLTFDGSPRAPAADTFSLGADDMRRKDWQVEVPTPGDKEITVYVQSRRDPKLSDAMALTIPALPHGRERVEARRGSVTDTLTERFIVRQDAVPGAGDLRLRLAPSLASVILGALEYLAHYPYGCTEQTMSAFLPDVVVARTRRELKLPNAKLEKQLPDMVRKGLDRLYGFQHEDGGWGWWRYDDTDPWMTSYVVFGLTLAKENGFAVNEDSLSKGAAQLTRLARNPGKMRDRDRSFLVYALALAGKGSETKTIVDDLNRRVNGLDTVTLARLASTLVVLRRTPEARAAARKLWGRVVETQSLAHWPGASDPWEHGEGDVETTALAFRAVATLVPDDPRLDKVVRWLVLHRNGNCWESTRDTAFVLYAITDRLKRTRELTPDYQVTATLDGRRLLNRRITQADLFHPEIEVTVPRRDLRQGDNLLTLTKAGPGALYYTAIFTQFVGQEDMTDLVTGSGLALDRKYYRLQSGRDPRTRVITTFPSSEPTTDFRSGEPILVRLTIITPKPLEYMVIEDPLPAGCEVQERGDVEPWEWSQWYSDMEVRDEKVAFFARSLPAGKSTLEYHLRPQIPGEYHVMPTTTYDMYAPELRGSGAETRVRIR